MSMSQWRCLDFGLMESFP